MSISKKTDLYDLACVSHVANNALLRFGIQKIYFHTNSFFLFVVVFLLFVVCLRRFFIILLSSSSAFVSKSLTIAMNQSILLLSSSEINRRVKKCFSSSSYESDWGGIAIFRNENFSFGPKLTHCLHLSFAWSTLALYCSLECNTHAHAHEQTHRL